MRLCLLWLLPRVIHDSTSCPQDRWINNERKESRRMLPHRLCTTDETLPTPTVSIGLTTSHSVRWDSGAAKVNRFYKCIILGMIQQLFIKKKKKRFIWNVWAELKITTLSGMFAEMNGCRFAWEKLITGCFHTPKCWSVCWWSWSSRLHTSLAGPQIPQVNTPAAESCGCLGCPARGDLSKHEQTMRKRRRDAPAINQSPGGNVKVDCGTRLCVSVGKKQNKRILQSTIVSSSPGEYFSLIGHSQNMGSAAWDLDQFVPEERLNYLGLGAKSHREVCYWI